MLWRWRSATFGVVVATAKLHLHWLLKNHG
jgi:hypothetical protein